MSSAQGLLPFKIDFHQAEDGRLLTDDDDDLLSVRGPAQLRPEGPGLRALDTLLTVVVEAVRQQRPTPCATVDVDASIVEAHKQRALRADEGTRGYQPQLA